MKGQVQLQEYWDRYALGIRADGAEWGSREFFQQVKIDHDQAYGYTNQILNIPVHRGKSVLEICCGIGIDSLELAKHGAEVTFVSPSPKINELTGKYFSYHKQNVTLQVEDAEHLPFPSNSFDVVIARGILMFTPHPERAMNEIHRVLKPNGEVYAHLHNKYSWYALLAKFSLTNFVDAAGDPPIHRLHSRKDVDQLFVRFPSRQVFFGRFPSKTKRKGPLAQLYNRLFIPLTTALPPVLMRRLGYYIIVHAVK